MNLFLFLRFYRLDFNCLFYFKFEEIFIGDFLFYFVFFDIVGFKFFFLIILFYDFCNGCVDRFYKFVVCFVMNSDMDGFIDICFYLEVCVVFFFCDRDFCGYFLIFGNFYFVVGFLGYGFFS